MEFIPVTTSLISRGESGGEESAGEGGVPLLISRGESIGRVWRALGSAIENRTKG